MADLNSGNELPDDTSVDVFSRLEAESIDTRGSAVDQSADFMIEADLLGEQKEVVDKARKLLQSEDPRELFYAFLRDSISDLQTAQSGQRYLIARQIDDVALAGLGIWQEDLGLRPIKNSLRVSGRPEWDRIKQHINDTVLGEYFLQKREVPDNQTIWGTTFPLRLSACDASQHRLKLKVPTNTVWASPVIVNNAGGVIKELSQPDVQWRNIAVPRGLREYEDWVILGPADYAEMEEGDYEWSAKSAMDVGQFFVEETFIFRHGGASKPPDVHFRDGRVFPQDKLMNSTIENRHGQLTREAIDRMVSTCGEAQKQGILFCGVAKQVQLKVYSTLINWYISRCMERVDWNPTLKSINDTEMMRHLLPVHEFHADFNAVLVATPIVRRFHTTSNLNRRTRSQVENDMSRLAQVHHNRNRTARDIAEEALKLDVVMFFAGHARTNEQFLPRYEYVRNGNNHVDRDLTRVLSALRSATFDMDTDHLRGLDEPINTLVPTPVLVAHHISKSVGGELALSFKQRTLARFLERRSSI
ncbi:MAG: hypothetical protein OXN88_01885 [Chloroflexota bacterium]|nr:hypothetical protein [Chloroflexota bacterium]